MASAMFDEACNPPGKGTCAPTKETTLDDYTGAPAGYHYVQHYTCNLTGCTLHKSIISQIVEGIKVIAKIGRKQEVQVENQIKFQSGQRCSYQTTSECTAGPRVLVPN